MSDGEVWRQMSRIKDTADRLGLMVGSDKYGNGVGVYPKDDEYPIFERDAQVCSGSLDQVAAFMHGLEWMRDYHVKLLKVTTKDKIRKAEQTVRNEQLMDRIRTGGEEMVL